MGYFPLLQEWKIGLKNCKAVLSILIFRTTILGVGGGLGIYYHFTGSQRVYKNALEYEKISNSQHWLDRRACFLTNPVSFPWERIYAYLSKTCKSCFTQQSSIQFQKHSVGAPLRGCIKAMRKPYPANSNDYFTVKIETWWNAVLYKSVLGPLPVNIFITNLGDIEVFNLAGKAEGKKGLQFCGGQV